MGQKFSEKFCPRAKIFIPWDENFLKIFILGHFLVGQNSCDRPVTPSAIGPAHLFRGIYMHVAIFRKNLEDINIIISMCPYIPRGFIVTIAIYE